VRRSVVALLQKREGVALVEGFARFGAGYAGVRGEAIVVIETIDWGPGRERGFAELGEMFLEALKGFAGVGIARGDGAAGAGIAAFKVNFADGEPDGTALLGAEQSVFPERGDAVDF